MIRGTTSRLIANSAARLAKPTAILRNHHRASLLGRFSTSCRPLLHNAHKNQNLAFLSASSSIVPSLWTATETRKAQQSPHVLLQTSRSFASSGQPPRNSGGGGSPQLPPWMHPDSNKPGHYLEQYTTDLTALAAEGKLDPVIGRHEEIRRCLQILARRTKSNPVLIGDAGVGKSAIAEGLAQRIQSGQVPESMKDKRVLSLDLAALTAGTYSSVGHVCLLQHLWCIVSHIVFIVLVIANRRWCARTV
jgi:ATP-dependent Clp protease ATP-binding subunit ClpA